MKVEASLYSCDTSVNDSDTVNDDEMQDRPLPILIAKKKKVSGAWKMKLNCCNDQDPYLLMSGSSMVRKTSLAIQKVQQKHSIDLLNKRAGVRRCKQLRMISGDVRIGKGFDFKAGGRYEDLSFEKERTLLQLWEIYRNGYTTEQVLECMYIPVILIEQGGRVKNSAERCMVDETMILELRARYQELKEEDLFQREEEELAKYNEIHNIQRREMRFKNNLFIEALSCAGSPKSSRPHSVQSCRDSPFSRSLDHEHSFEDDADLIKPEKEPLQLLCLCFHNCCFANEE